MDKIDRSELILHPLRLRILMAVEGERRSVRQIAEALPDIPPATLYRHLNTLVDGGILTVVEERQIRGTVAKVYALGDPRAAQLTGADLAGATKEDHMRYFTTFVASLLGEFSRYLQSVESVDLESDGAGYHADALYLSDEELRQVVQELNRIVKPLFDNARTPDRRRRVLSTVLISSPDEEELR